MSFLASILANAIHKVHYYLFVLNENCATTSAKRIVPTPSDAELGGASIQVDVPHYISVCYWFCSSIRKEVDRTSC